MGIVRQPQQRYGRVAPMGKTKDPAAPKKGSPAIEPYKQFKKRTGTTLPNQGKGKKAK